MCMFTPVCKVSPLKPFPPQQRCHLLGRALGQMRRHHQNLMHELQGSEFGQGIFFKARCLFTCAGGYCLWFLILAQILKGSPT